MSNQYGELKNLNKLYYIIKYIIIQNINFLIIIMGLCLNLILINLKLNNIKTTK